MSHSQRMSENFQVVSAEFWRDQTRCLCSLEQLENILTSWKFHKIILFMHKTINYRHDKKGFTFCCIQIIVFTLFTQNWCKILVIISFKYSFKFFMCGHAWVNFRVLTRWKCFTQNTIFKLILKIYEFSLKFHAERIQHNTSNNGLRRYMISRFTSCNHVITGKQYGAALKILNVIFNRPLNTFRGNQSQRRI